MTDARLACNTATERADIAQLQEIEEAALVRAERAIRSARLRRCSVCVCDHFVIAESFTESPNECHHSS